VLTVHISDLRAALVGIPVVDAHQHLLGHECCVPRDDVTNFITGFHMNSMLRFADQRLADIGHDGA
jgi:hypothetical protein